MANFHVVAGAQGGIVRPRIRRIDIGEVFGCLGAGIADFRDRPSHYVFLLMIYPIIGIVLLTWAAGADALPLVYPLISGFALLGPFAALGIYEISRRKEQGLDTHWRDVLALRHSPALPSIAGVGVFLFAVFLAWLLVARQLYIGLIGTAAPSSLAAFWQEIVGTEAGWTLIVAGNLIGLAFALVVLATTVVAFPMLLDRDVGAYSAMETSVRAFLKNPLPILVWGMIVAAGLALGMATLLVGLIVILPILGHATWHLYRSVVGMG
ncbi:DUF2189 domain-containing protein [Mesorhizobium sp. YIM 152430]|uniref:DUF2189 domain-containing protein n=1 Tax=Mesorhizobium sp. YIM 152430 TaxID=3031761 RepID=UPI0023DADE39|nr:DUF2189 domain-containing protein [Mesorhizobium sp. YIM 152430]MDF1598533.1 DUF2189 domain-containing protein [Mesorhizobium sp. YIM 152430]